MKTINLLALAGITLGLAACSTAVPTPKSEAMRASQPVEIEDSNYGRALVCLAQYTAPLRGEVFSAFAMKDGTGKANYGESGTGRFLSESTEHYVISALDKAGLRQRNAQIIGYTEAVVRHLPKAAQESALARLLLPTKTLDGSTPGLGWVPGGGISIGVDLIEAGFRRYGIAVDKVMTLTDFSTGQVERTTKLRVIANATEISAGTFRVFGRRIIGVDAGFVDRQLLPVVEEAMTDWLVYASIRPMVKDANAAECDKWVLATPDGTASQSVKTSDASERPGDLDAIERRPAPARSVKG